MNFYLFLFLAILAIFWPGHNVRAEPFSWPEATPEEVNIDPRMIADLTAAIERGEYGRLKSLLILRHGLLVHEQYFNGYRQDERMPLYSVTKSWGSALVGIGIDRNEIPSIDTSIEAIFPQ